MANPQIENGHTRIANELLEAIFKYVTNPTWLRLSLVIIRLTYGWQRKEVISNIKSFSKLVRMTEEYVKTSLVEMELEHMVVLEFKNPREFKVSINKDYEQWKCVQR